MSAGIKPKATRQSFGEALAEAGERHADVVVLDADLSKSTKSELFRKRFPERFFQMGIAEQNMVGVAAGLGMSGKTAFCCSFACFVAGRFETIKISVAYGDANVKVVGSHAGVGVGADGYSQMGLEDIALMRSLANMRVFQPADDIETAAIVEHLCATPGPAYLRLTRHNLPRVHAEDYRFEEGKLDELRQGKDIALLCGGGTVSSALEAAQVLSGQGIDAAVVNVPSIKPLDRAAVDALCDRFDTLLSVEDHTVHGGLGSALAELVVQHGGARLHIRGVPDVFGESGSQQELYKKFALDADGIAAAVKSVL